VRGSAFHIFFISGCVGFGLGDTTLFLTLSRLGPRLSSLLINCLGAPFAALIEWLWMGTRLTPLQVLSGVGILVGVGLALAPEKHAAIQPRKRLEGLAFGVLSGFGQGLGAVLSRKGFAAAAVAGQEVDGGTAAYQRILGGLAIITIPWVWSRLRDYLRDQPSAYRQLPPRERWAALRWVLLNGLAGPAIGVAFYQLALKSTPSGIVMPIIATTPLVIIPLAWHLEGDRPGTRSLLGGLVAVVSVVALTLASAGGRP
jgi:drug/metabolite transporter (DMT)-like permease